MGWARIDDGLHSHPKAYRVSLPALGLWTIALSYAAHYETDGFIEDGWLRSVAARHGSRGRALVHELVDAGFLEPAEGGFDLHDYLDYNPSREQLGRSRAKELRKKALQRDRHLVAGVRARDADHCRYCDRAVDWKDRRSASAGTYDHVDPRGDNTLENVVVACSACNNAKGSRTPSVANMPLLPARGAQMGMPGPSPDLAGPRSEPNPHAMGGGGQKNSNGQNSPRIDAGARLSDQGTVVDQVLRILNGCRRFVVDDIDCRVGVENAIGAVPDRDPIAAARTAVVWASDPAWNTTAPARVFHLALQKQEPGEAPRATANAAAYRDGPVRCADCGREHAPDSKTAGRCDRCYGIWEAQHLAADEGAAA